MNFTDAYKLEDIEVEPDRLLLDPNNPRLAIELEEAVGTENIIDSNVQDYVRKTIMHSEYHVRDLIEQISSQGFLEGSNPIIVEKLSDLEKYLVLEGNRRVTAVKEILRNPTLFEEDIIKSVRKLPVKKFIYIENSQYTKRDVIDALLGTIHVTGAVHWGALERARYIYRSYLRECGAKNVHTYRFKYDKSIAENIAKRFGIKENEVKKLITIYRVYRQLKEADVDVDPSRYSLLEMSVSNAALKNEYFELDKNELELSQVGMRRFDNMCVREGCSINNPQEMRRLAKIVRSDAGMTTLYNIEEGVESLDEVYEKLERRKKYEEEKTRFKDYLQSALSFLEELNPDWYQNTTKEIQLIRDIQNKAEILSRLIER